MPKPAGRRLVPRARQSMTGTPEHFQYGLSFRGKMPFFRSIQAGRRCPAALRFIFFKDETRWSTNPLLPEHVGMSHTD